MGVLDWRLLRRGSIAALLMLGCAASSTWALPNCGNGNRATRSGKINLLDVVGLTQDGRLVCFKDRSPQRPREIGMITGLTGTDTALIGIDFRVQDGQLYGVGNGGGIYTLALDTAVATPVNTLTEMLTPGASFGVDFNPAADRLRVVSDAGLNLRHNVNAGGTTLRDGSLAYTAGVNATGIHAAAYVNNDLSASTGTTLFDLDTDLDQVSLQSPPNAGNLVATGKLGVDASPPVGLDIYSATVEGVTVANKAYASFVAFGQSAFYEIDLLTGAAIFVDVFDEPMADIAIPLGVE